MKNNAIVIPCTKYEKNVTCCYRDMSYEKVLTQNFDVKVDKQTDGRTAYPGAGPRSLDIHYER